MTFKTILVSLNHEKRVAALVSAAAVIARRTDAHVIGLYVMPPLFMPSDVILPMGSEFYQQQISEHHAQSARIKKRFEELTHGESFVAEWRIQGDARSAYGTVADGVVQQSRSAELVIVSQACDGIAPPMLTDIPQRVALESGRPVLVVPVKWSPCEFGHDIAIAWNDSREASRATFDAVPLMRNAKTVRLLTIGETTDDDGTTTMTATDIASTLARHGLKVDVEAIDDNSRNVGPAILARVVSDRADLLVMGAYGHSRMREFILGGATRDMLKSMTVPVLMSH